MVNMLYTDINTQLSLAKVPTYTRYSVLFDTEAQHTHTDDILLINDN